MLWFNILLDRTKQIVVDWIDVGRQYLNDVDDDKMHGIGSKNTDDENEKEDKELPEQSNVGDEGQQASANDKSELLCNTA